MPQSLQLPQQSLEEIQPKKFCLVYYGDEVGGPNSTGIGNNFLQPAALCRLWFWLFFFSALLQRKQASCLKLLENQSLHQVIPPSSISLVECILGLELIILDMLKKKKINLQRIKKYQPSLQIYLLVSKIFIEARHVPCFTIIPKAWQHHHHSLGIYQSERNFLFLKMLREIQVQQKIFGTNPH